MLGLGAKVEGDSSGSAPLSARPVDRWARRSRRCPQRRRPAAWPPARRGCPAGDHVDPRDLVGAVGERGDRLRPAHAVDLVDAAVARTPPGSPDAGCRSRRRADRDLLDARRLCGHRAHHHRARVGRAASRHVDRRPADGTSRRTIAGPVAARPRLRCAKAGQRDRSARCQRRARDRRGPPGRARRVRSSARPCRRAAASRPPRPVELGALYSRTAASPSAATRATISRTAAVTDPGGGRGHEPLAAAPLVAADRGQALSRHGSAHQVVDRPRLELVRHRVGDQPRGRGRDLLADHQAVLPGSCRSRSGRRSPSTRPVSGASSTEPLTSTISACGRSPRSSRSDLAVLGRDPHHAEAAQRLRAGSTSPSTVA